MLNNVTFVGRLTADPELRNTQGGKPVVSCSIAVQNTKEETVFISTVFWNKLAETLAKYCTKGSLISVQGFLKNDKYKDVQILRVVAVQFYMLEPKKDNKENLPF
jgi:single-strand DNA-binding protein|nr:MAG TPA: Single strand binding protein [Caudoviricetes sp.]